MPRSPFSCTDCGHWPRYFAAPPNCPVCSDAGLDTHAALKLLDEVIEGPPLTHPIQIER